MSLLDKMKQNIRETTGYGLNAKEQYNELIRKAFL